jgi:hypothetical protein
MIIGTTERNLRGVQMLEKMGKNQNFICTTHGLYSIAYKCTLMEEGRLGLDLAANTIVEPVNADASLSKKRKRNTKKGFVADPSIPAEPAKPAKWCPLSLPRDRGVPSTYPVSMTSRTASPSRALLNLESVIKLTGQPTTA